MNENADQPQSSWKDRRKQQLRDELLSVSLRLFRENGIESTSVDDVVRAAGVAKGTFYLHFKAKADLVTEAINSLFDELESRVAQVISMAPEDARVTLRAVLKAHLSFIQENKGIASMILLSGKEANFADMPEEQAEALRSRALAATLAVYERIIRTGMLQTHFREVDAALAALALQGILTAFAYNAIEHEDDLSGIDSAVLEFFEKGIRRGI